MSLNDVFNEFIAYATAGRKLIQILREYKNNVYNMT